MKRKNGMFTCTCGKLYHRPTCPRCMTFIKARMAVGAMFANTISKCSTTPALLRRNNPERLVILKQEREAYNMQ